MEDFGKFFQRNEGIDILAMEEEGRYLQNAGFEIVFEHKLMEYLAPERMEGDEKRTSRTKRYFEALVRWYTPEIYDYDISTQAGRAKSDAEIDAVLKDVEASSASQGYGVIK